MTPRFLSSWRLDVTTLGPVHIGCGAEMDPTNYVLDAAIDALFEFAPDALPAVLDERDRKVFLDLVSGSVTKYTIPRVQKFIHDRRDALIAHAARAVRVSSGVGELHKERIGTIAQTETGDINKLAIEKSLNDRTTGAPVLPGSSLKGSVRTALLNRINAGKKRRGGEQSLALQKRLFQYDSFETDPMRLVHIADAMWTGGKEGGDLTAETAVTFAVNRKKKPIVKDGKEIRSQAQQKGLYQILEVIPAFRRRALRSQLTLHRIDIAHEKRPKLHWGVPEIAKACNAFYLRDFEDEREALRDRGLLDENWDRSVQNLMDDGMRGLLESNRAFLLRVGRHSGAESVTLDGVRDIRIMTPQGQPNRWEEEATTWWLASDRIDASFGLFPFGWLLVEVTEDDGTPEPRPEKIADALDSFHGESGEQKWRVTIMQRRAALRQEQEAAASRRAEAQQLRRAQAEAEHEREKKRAAMTDEEREIDDLRSLLAKSQQAGSSPQTQGGELAGRASQLLKTAREWPEKPRLQAADLIQEIFQTIGFPKGRKGRERKQQISDLRGGA